MTAKIDLTHWKLRQEAVRLIINARRLTGNRGYALILIAARTAKQMRSVENITVYEFYNHIFEKLLDYYYAVASDKDIK